MITLCLLADWMIWWHLTGSCFTILTFLSVSLSTCRAMNLWVPSVEQISQCRFPQLVSSLTTERLHHGMFKVNQCWFLLYLSQLIFFVLLACVSLYLFDKIYTFKTLWLIKWRMRREVIILLEYLTGLSGLVTSSSDQTTFVRLLSAYHRWARLNVLRQSDWSDSFLYQ